MKSIAGIDVSKGSFDVFFAGRSKSFENDDAGHREAAKFCKGAELIVMEATGSYHLAPACFLHAKGFKVAVVNPARPSYYAKSLGLRSKTDRVDARMLALFGAAHEPPLFVPPTENEFRLCRLVRLRSDLAAQRAQGRARRHDPAMTEFERAMWDSQEAFLTEQIRQVEREIRGVIASEERFKEAFDHLTSIPGIGAVTAWTILAELRDVKLFASAKKAAAYAGVCPSVRHSGTSLSGPGRLSRQGCAQLRKALYMAAVAAIRIPSPFQAFYLRLLEKGKARKSALAAVMHKLIRVAYGVLKEGAPFNPERDLTIQ